MSSCNISRYNHSLSCCVFICIISYERNNPHNENSKKEETVGNEWMNEVGYSYMMDAITQTRQCVMTLVGMSQLLPIS